jgi:hypothetical protein
MIRLRAPSPTTVIACIALFLALGGSGYIAFAHGGASVAKKKKVKAGPRGPAGINGTNGTNGTNGAPGTARAYGLVSIASTCTPNCALSLSTGISNVTHASTGTYCVFVPGVDAHLVSAVADAATGPSTSPEGDGTAQTFTFCTGTNAFEVKTYRKTAGGAAAVADDVGFTIIVP